MDKICTDIPQSRKFIKLGIDVNTADMTWQVVRKNRALHLGFNVEKYKEYSNELIPAWSLTALLELLYRNNSLVYFDGMYNMVYGIEPHYTSPSYSDPLSAAFEMICWLKKNNKL